MIPNPFLKEGKKKEKNGGNHLKPEPLKSAELSENYDSVLIDEAIVTVDQKMMMHNTMISKQPKKKFLAYLRIEKYFEAKVNGIVVTKQTQTDQAASLKLENHRLDQIQEASNQVGHLEEEKKVEGSHLQADQKDRKKKKELSMLKGNVSADVLKSMQLGVLGSDQSSNNSKKDEKLKIKKTKTLGGNRALSAEQIIGKNMEEVSENSNISKKSILKKKESLRSENASESRKVLKKQVSFSNKKSVVNYNPHKFSGGGNQSPLRRTKK